MVWLRHLGVLFAFLVAFVRSAGVRPHTFKHRNSRWGFEVAAHLPVGGLGVASREQHPRIGAAYDENASGYRLAAKVADCQAMRWYVGEAGVLQTAQAEQLFTPTIRNPNVP